MKHNKVVIYTAIAGGIDDLIQHKYRSPEFDYVCFSDRPVDEPGMWDVRLIEGSQLDDVRKAKYYKLFPHELFPEYLYSVWVDGNIDVLDDTLENRVLELISNDTLIAANIHPHRSCSYEEANACVSMGKDDTEVILRQVDFMESNGFPRDLGLFAMMLICRKHQERKVIQLMVDWWWMIQNFSRRDQISFMYVLFKNNMNCAVLFKQDIYNDPAFSFKKHSKIIYAKLMVDTGDGFSYKNMIIQRFLAKKESITEMSFDLGKISKVKRLRLYPFDTGVGRIKLLSIDLYSFDNQLVNIEMRNIKSNGFLMKDGYIAFQTFNPTIEILVNDWVGKIVVSGIFSIEKEMVSKQIISNKLEMIHKSFFWKLREAALWLPRNLYALSKKCLSQIY